MAAKIVVDSSVLVKWIKTKDEQLLNEAHRLLVAAAHDAHPVAHIVQRVEDVQVVDGDDAEEGIHAVGYQRLHNCLTSSHPGHGTSSPRCQPMGAAMINRLPRLHKG